MFGRRAGRGGLLRAAAATAVVAGTATAVSGGVRARQEARSPQGAHVVTEEQRQQQAQIDRVAQEATSAQRLRSSSPPPDTAPGGGDGGELVAQIQALADLRERGLLSEEEFLAGKARLLT